MIKTKNGISAAVLFSLLFPLISSPGAYAQSLAYSALASGARNTGMPAPEVPSAAFASIGGEKSASRESLRIIKMSDQELAAASLDQRLQMLRTLVRDSHPDNNNSDSNDWDQKDVENTILRVLDSAPDAAAFDYMYYRIKKGRLEYAVGWYKDIVERVNKYRRTTVPGDWAGLNRYVDTVSQSSLTGRNLIKFLIDGKDVMSEASKALRGAEKYIHIEVFQLQPDNIGRGLARVLAEKVKAGVKVRMLIDEHGSSAEDDMDIQDLLKTMRADGIEIIVKKAPFLKKHLDHRKVVVIDGKIGFTGGMNIGRWYQVDWHDQQTLIEGPAVAKLQEAFVERWRAAKGSIPAGEDLFPRTEEFPGGSETRVVQHIGLRDQNIKAMYLRAIGTAEKSIKIANPYFTDEDVVDALRWAARRGVKVQLVLPEDNDQAIVQHASRYFYPRLVRSGVEVYEYKGRMAHEKVAVIDGSWATFGSSNLDARSLINNDELNLVVTDPAVAEDIEKRLFDADIPNCELMNNYDRSVLDHMAHMVNGLL